jgi:rubrerythrin
MQECFSQDDVIKMALQIEQSGKAFYETAAQKATDPKLTELFRYLAGEEDSHIETFQKLSNEVKSGSKTLGITKPEDLLYLETMMKSQLFQGADKAINLVQTASTPVEVLSRALDFERDVVLFFVKLFRMVCEKDRKLISKLIKEEEHILKLSEHHNKLKLPLQRNTSNLRKE